MGLTSHASRRRIRRHARRRHIRGFGGDSPGLLAGTFLLRKHGGLSPRRGFLAAPRRLVRYGTAFAGNIEARCRIHRYADLECFTLNNSGVLELLGNASFNHGRVGVHMIASTCIEGIAFVPVR